MTELPAILVDKRDHVAVITLNRPMQRNAIDAELSAALRDAITDMENDPAIRVGILCGNGAVFCAGMDLKAFLGGASEDILFGKDRLGGLVSRTRTKPLIAAVQGAALAGGFELTLACDMIVAAEGTVFGLPEPKIGLFAGAGGAMRICEHLPKAIANEALLTGDPITADTALRYGVLNAVVPADDLLATALALAAKIAACAPLSVQHSLALAGDIRTAQLETLWDKNDAALRQILETNDAKEGTQAFLDRRAPDWSGT